MTDCSHHVVLCYYRDFGDSHVDAFLADTAKTRGQSIEDLKGYEQIMKGFLSNFDQEKTHTWMKDQVYIALGNLMTTCAMLKIDACPMEGIVPAKYDEILGLKEKGLMTAVACAIGYRTDTDKYAAAAKVRFPKSEVVEFLE